tara:strand:- start:757 stop:939 length:183 start_codon:yes stop_codon:yes gene_type:complete
MCLICVEITRDRLTSAEAFRNLRELCIDMDEEHFAEVIEKIIDLEQQERVKRFIEDEENT